MAERRLREVMEKGGAWLSGVVEGGGRGRGPLAQASAIMLPPSMVISPASTKTGQWPRPSAISTNIGTIIAMPSTDTKRPMTYPTGRKSNICAALARRRAGVKDTPCGKTQNGPGKTHPGRQ